MTRTPGAGRPRRSAARSIFIWATLVTALTGALSATVAFGQWLGVPSSDDEGSSTSPDPHSTGSDASTFDIRSGYTGKCLDVYGYSVENAGRVLQFTCNGGTNQQWRWGDGRSLVNVFSGKCLDAYAFGTDNGTDIVQYECNGEANQQWTVALDGDDEPVLKSDYTGKCLDLYAFNTGDGGRVTIWACNDKKNQVWRMTPGGRSPETG